MSTEDRCERMELFMFFGQELQLLVEAVTLGHTFVFILQKKTVWTFPTPSYPELSVQTTEGHYLQVSSGLPKDLVGDDH